MMPKYLIDTNILIELMRKNQSIVRKFAETGIENCAVSFYSLCELYYGAYHIKDKTYQAEELNKINVIRNKFTVISTMTNAEIFGQIKANLYAAGKKVDDMDILIGSLAVANGMTVVTDNEKHFSRMPGIKCENWLER